jgi:hypothetical protein
MSQIKTYCITVRYITNYEVYINAKNEDEAWDLVQDFTDDEIMVNGPVSEEYDAIVDVEEMDGSE